MKTIKSFDAIENPRDIRKKLGMNQQEFWGQIGVTQSGGSRYESGRNIPKAVRELLRLVHIEKVNLAKINGEDLAITQLLKAKEPELYKTLKKEIKSKA
jgi:transcriptional regulator with XRE-family HTH domain